MLLSWLLVVSDLVEASVAIGCLDHLDVLMSDVLTILIKDTIIGGLQAWNITQWSLSDGKCDSFWQILAFHIHYKTQLCFQRNTTQKCVKAEQMHNNSIAQEMPQNLKSLDSWQRWIWEDPLWWLVSKPHSWELIIDWIFAVIFHILPFCHHHRRS